MKPILLILVSFFSIAFSFAQKTNALRVIQAKPEVTYSIPDTLRTIRTASCIAIPGTRVLMSPGPGFRIASNFVGLVKDSITGIVVTDIPGSSFFLNTKDMSKATLESGGATVFEFREFVFNGYQARFIQLMGDNHLRGMNLIFGDSSFSVMLAGLFVPSDSVTGLSLRKTILSAVFEKGRKINPFETVAFRLDESKSVFKFVSYTGGAFKYTPGGRKQPAGDPKNETLLMVAVLPLSRNTKVQTACEQMLLSAQQNGLANFRIESASPLKISGYPAYEMMISGYIKGERSNVYLLTVNTRADQVVQFQGLSTYEDKKSTSEMKKLALTLKTKN